MIYSSHNNSKSSRAGLSSKKNTRANSEEEVVVTKKEPICDLCMTSGDCNCSYPRVPQTSISQPVVIEDRDYNSTQEMNKVWANITKDKQLAENCNSEGFIGRVLVEDYEGEGFICGVRR